MPYNPYPGPFDQPSMTTPRTTDAGYEDVEATARSIVHIADGKEVDEFDTTILWELADALADMRRQRDDIQWRAHVEACNATNARRWMEENQQRAEVAERERDEARAEIHQLKVTLFQAGGGDDPGEPEDG